MRDLASTFCRRSPCLPRAAPSLMIPTDYGANIESWEGQHRHKETQGRPTWTHRRPTQTQAYKVPKRNTGKEIQTKGCRRKCWIFFQCYLNFFLNAHHFGQDNCFCLLQKLLWGKCYALFKSKCWKLFIDKCRDVKLSTFQAGSYLPLAQPAACLGKQDKMPLIVPIVQF